MCRSPLHLFVLPLVGVMACVAVATAQENAGAAKMLEKFFELGLPDAKGGQWAQIATMDSEDRGVALGGRRANLTGNGWVLRESRGVVEAVTVDGHLVRGRKMRDDEAEPADDGLLRPVHVEPANLDEDLQTMMAGLKEKDTGRNSGDEENQAQMRGRIAGGALLFLAQLQRQGRGDFVRDALPLVLASVPSPETALDGAVSLLADAQLAALARQWVEKGDAVAYAAALEKLAATFPRGWGNRDAALFLAAKVRSQKPSPLAAENDARLASDFLFKLKPAQLQELPAGSNWFLHGLHRGAGMRGIEEFSGDVPDAPEDARANGKPAKTDAAIEAFFANKRAAATALAKLLDDHRYLRTTARQDGSSRYSRFSFGGHESREQKIRAQYDQLPRPSEVGEVAWSLVSPLLPEDVRDVGAENTTGRAASTLAWLNGITAKTDEDLAWDYLRNSGRTYSDEFSGGLAFLVEKGGAETLAKLREVFLDPAVWRGGGDGAVLQQVEKYVKRAPADPAFADKLRAAVKLALDEDEAESGRYSQSNEESAKLFRQQAAAQRAARMKQIEQVFKPTQTVAEQLAEILAMEETEAIATLNAAAQSLAKKPVAEIEGPIFQAAAKAKPVALKSQLLQLFMNISMRGARGQPSAPGALPDLPGDAATREAMLSLLRDETRIPNDYDPANTTTFRDMTSWAVLSLHTSQARQNDLRKLGASVPHLAKKWMQTDALAIANGQPLPPMPSAAKLAAGRPAALVAELSALSAAQIEAAFAGKSPDEQVAIVEHLQAAAEWPAAIVEAHFSVSEFGGAEGVAVGAPEWKGRRFDEKFIGEIQAAVENSAAAGKPCMVDVNGGEPLAGVRITVHESPRKLTVEEFAGYAFPGLSGQPAPVAFAYFGFMGGGNADEGPKQIGYGFPIWKDAAVTRAWRNAHGKAAAAAPKNSIAIHSLPTDPAPFEQQLRAALAFRKDARARFRFTFSAMGIGAEKGSPAVPGIPSVPGL